MIKLDVEDYCHDCKHFSGAVQEPYELGDKHYIGDYIVQCEYRDICADLLKRRKHNGF